MPDSLPALTQLPPGTLRFGSGKSWLGEMVAGQNKQVDDCPLPDEDKGQACMSLGLHEVQRLQAPLVPCLLVVCEQ